MTWNFIDFETIGSTNDEAIKKTEQCVISAKAQTNGRGRRGRNWIACEGNLFASIVLKAEAKDIWKIICTTTVALIETIGTGQIKWPNDILINSKKVCGILIEAGNEGFFVIGFGVNIKQAPQIEDLLYPATSLKDEKIEFERLEFLHTYMNNFDKTWQDKNINLQYKKHLYGVGKNAKINDKEGTFIGVDESGYLLLQNNETIEKIYTGDLFI